MCPQVLRLNPTITVLHNKGVLIASQLAGSASPVQLALVDVALLQLFLGGATPDDVLTQLLVGPTRRLLGSIPGAEWLRGRIAQLHAAEVLVASAAPPQSSSGALISLNGCPERPPAPGLLRLGLNIALTPGPASFELWCPRTRSLMRPDLEVVLLMLSFVEPTTASEVASGDAARRAAGIAWLIDIGVLVSVEARVPTPAWNEAFARGEASRAGVDWRELEPDGRIPVYFAPHTGSLSLPLALGMISAAIAAHDDGALLERFQLLPISWLTPYDLFTGPYQRFGPGIWLFSNYVWSLDTNLEMSRALVAMDPTSVTLHGGPSVPGYPRARDAFMHDNPSVHVAVHGEGEIAVAQVLECVHRAEDGGIVVDSTALAQVAGLTFRSVAGELISTPVRARITDLDALPSPYLTGQFDAYGEVVEAIVETNRGCPFACTFCDWGSATRQKVRKFDLDRVKAEIEWVGQNRCPVLWIADANYGMYDRDIELAAFVVATKERYGFPREVAVNYTKNTTGRLVEIIRIFSDAGIISQGILSIQTTDPATLKVIERSNIRTAKYDELATVFADAELPLSTDLMLGLPGITPEAFDRDLQRCFDVDVATKAYPTRLLPNSPMADPAYMERHQIQVDDGDLVVSCISFTAGELDRMKLLFDLFTLADGYSILRYVLRYLQWEHGLPAIAVLHSVLDEVGADPAAYPSISWVLSYFMAYRFMPGGWKRFYDEIAALCETVHGVQRDSAFDAVLRFNEVVMPDDTLVYPLTAVLEHDVVGWFQAQPGGDRPLSTWPAASFAVDDPEGMASLDIDSARYDSHQYFWELRSVLARARSLLAPA